MPNEDEDVAQAILAASEENLGLILRAALSYAQRQAAEEVLQELGLLLPDIAPGIPALSAGVGTPALQFPARGEAFGFERLERLLSRFIDDLFREAARRFWLADLLDEPAEVAAASLAEDTILARALPALPGAAVNSVGFGMDAGREPGAFLLVITGCSKRA